MAFSFGSPAPVSFGGISFDAPRNAKKNVSYCQLLAGLDEFEPPVQIK